MSMFEVLSLISLPLCSTFLVCYFEFQIKNINYKIHVYVIFNWKDLLTLLSN
ncbi:hypothetical protein GLYMA_19G084850v4 [Glycine max]|nr:hypothetical protein GLYMA_19G084850v4 [Glycine max]KAH1076925.1 hypothetical protein GYH30_052438 [Glycine max]